MIDDHLFFRLLRLPQVRIRLFVCIACLFMFLPLGDLILWRYVYGFINDLSPTTLILFFVWFGFPQAFHFWAQTEMPFKRRLILWGSMLLFYILALGSGVFDPYAYGYQPWLLLVGLSLWVAWHGRSAPGLTLLLGVDLGIFSLHGLASDNLWDYLFDPVLMIVLGISLLRSVMSRRKIRLQSNV